MKKLLGDVLVMAMLLSVTAALAEGPIILTYAEAPPWRVPSWAPWRRLLRKRPKNYPAVCWAAKTRSWTIDMPLSSDPMLDDLRQQLAGVELGKPETAEGKLGPILQNVRIFGNGLTATPLAHWIEQYFREEIAGKGAVMSALKNHLT